MLDYSVKRVSEGMSIDRQTWMYSTFTYVHTRAHIHTYTHFKPEMDDNCTAWAVKGQGALSVLRVVRALHGRKHGR